MNTIKTAISIDKGLYEKVNNFCDRIKLSRSQFFSQAAAFFITKSENIELVKKLNKAYADLDPKDDELLSLHKAKYKKTIADKW